MHPGIKPLFVIAFAATMLSLQPASFIQQQVTFPRVKQALKNTNSALTNLLDHHNIARTDFQLIISAYKAEGKLQLWIKRTSSNTYTLLHTYAICATSGTLGPKRAQGDMQVPEGLYHIDRFNGASTYHLSLGISYPNASDKKLKSAPNVGGDIFIHGKCVTIGCLPMTDTYIEQIYILAMLAKSNGQQHIPVYIFPFEMHAANMEKYATQFAGNTAVLSFWKNLQPAYQKFATTQQALSYTIDANGGYRIR